MVKESYILLTSYKNKLIIGLEENEFQLNLLGHNNLAWIPLRMIQTNRIVKSSWE